MAPPTPGYPKKTTGTPQPLAGRCGAKLKYTDGIDGPDTARYCKKWPLRGRKRCEMCGGSSLSGIASPKYKPGIYSAALPAGVARIYEQLLGDDQLLSMRHEIALTRARLVQHLPLAATTMGPAAMKAALAFMEEWERFTTARNSGQAIRVKHAMSALERAVKALGKTLDALRREADAMEEVRRDIRMLIAEEHREDEHIEQTYTIFTAERAFAMREAETSIFLEALDALEPNREIVAAIRRRVAAKFAEFTGRRDHSAVDPSRGQFVSGPGDPAAPNPGGAQGLLPPHVGPGVPGPVGVPGA